MKSFYILAIAALTLVSCRGNKTEQAVDESKMNYMPQTNVVSTVPLKKCAFEAQLLSNGKLSAVRKSKLYFKQAGVIKKLNVSNGSRIEKDAIIAKLDDADQQARLRSSRISLDKAELDLQDYLVGYGYDAKGSNVSEEFMKTSKIRSGYDAAYDSYSQCERELAATVMTAPFSGRIADLKLKEYDTSGSEALCSVIDDSEFDVEFTVLESEYSDVAKGQKVKVTLLNSSQRSYTGQIVSVNPSVDARGQITVIARIANSGGLVDGMNVKVVVSRTIAEQYVVPKSAVVIRDGLEVMFRYVDGKAEWVYVNTLRANSESYSIQANADRSATIAEGDQVIYSGNLNLADGSDVILKQE